MSLLMMIMIREVIQIIIKLLETESITSQKKMSNKKNEMYVSVASLNDFPKI